MKKGLIRLIKEAGDKVLQFYRTGSKSKACVLKTDHSPLTVADQVSHQCLSQGLGQIKNVPVLSEECPIEFQVRKTWSEFWLIDPLDGTKEFLSGFDDFCINIALIKNKKPVLGVIYAPALHELYYAESGGGLYYEGATHDHIREKGFVVGLSRFHHSALTEQFMRLNNLKNALTVGAAIKFGRMALGQLDVYPRFEGSKEWDTAAGHVILNESQANIVDLMTKDEPLYNKVELTNHYFIACRQGIDVHQFLYPEFS